MLTANEGSLDRWLRAIIGIVLLSLVFVGPRTPWGWLGLVPLATGLVGFCPLYRVLGLSTCPLQGRPGRASGTSGGAAGGAP
jgi:hypothetical protein